jgi:hypothetical protein
MCVHLRILTFKLLFFVLPLVNKWLILTTQAGREYSVMDKGGECLCGRGAGKYMRAPSKGKKVEREVWQVDSSSWEFLGKICSDQKFLSNSAVTAQAEL